MPHNPNPRGRKRKQQQNQRELSSSSWEGTKVREPYPDHPHPTPEQCRSARDALLQVHGFPKEFASYQKQRKRKRNNSKNGHLDDLDDDDDDEDSIAVADNSSSSSSVLDGLISTLLSQNTTDANSTKAFQSLKSTFPSWKQVLDSDPKSLENAIRCGGLAATKAARIKSILKTVSDKRGGQLCLEYLRGLPVDDVKAELSQFKGIGPKTVACVLMFQLQKEDFPVDTHVFRITKALGWIPMRADREKAYLHLNNRIPDELKFDLNCLFVTHGKLCKRCVNKQGNIQIGGPRISCPLKYVTVVSADRG